MKVYVLFSYIESVIPPRCRKARLISRNDGKLKLSIKELASDQAPVAIRSKGIFIFKDRKPFEVEYRLWKGQLWTSMNIDGVEPRGRYSGMDNWDWPVLPSKIDIRDTGRDYDSDFSLQTQTFMYEEAVAQLRAISKTQLIIDGKYYRPTSEPRYVVMTFGLGANHGGTSCSMSDFYNSNISHERYFNLLERDQAVALATKIATNRRDTKNLPIVPDGPKWEVLIPEAIKVKPNKQHGKGDPFLNLLDVVSQTSGGSHLIGTAAMATQLS